MTKQFSRLQLLSLTDGRLSTNMGDVYDMLNHIMDDDLTTIALPIAYDTLEDKNPEWFQRERDKLAMILKDNPECIIKEEDTTLIIKNRFNLLKSIIANKYNDMIDIPQLIN